VNFRAAIVIAVLVGLSSPASAQPYGYSVNSRGFLPDDQMHLLWRVDLATGATEAIGPTGFDKMEALALAPDGTLYGADDALNTLVTVNTNSGFSSPVGGITTNMGVPLQNLDLGMTFACDGTLLVVSAAQQSLFSASLETGLLSRIGDAGSLGVPITGIAARGNQLYGIGQGRDSTDQLVTAAPNLYRIDRESASAELIGPLGPAVAPYVNAGLDFDAEGRLWALTDRRDGGQPNLFSQILEIDPASGQAVRVIDSDVVGFESLATAPAGACTPAIGAGTAEDLPMIPVNHPFALFALILAMVLIAGWTFHAQRR